jgi:hypothetical protein
MTVGDGLPVHRHMVDKTVASRQVTRHVSQRDRHAGNLSPRHTTAVDLAAAHGLADTLDSRRNLAAARRRLRGQSPAGGGSQD